MTDATRSLLIAAREHADAWQHEYVGTEHLLFALLHSNEQEVVEVLNRAGVDIPAALASLEGTLQRGQGSVPTPPYTSRGKDALMRAENEAREEPSDIEPRHLLLGLLGNPRSISCAVLNATGVTLEAARLRIHAPE